MTSGMKTIICPVTDLGAAKAQYSALLGVGYWHVDDINGSLQALLDAGAEKHEDVNDVGGGKLIATVKDVDGISSVCSRRRPAGGHKT